MILEVSRDVFEIVRGGKSPANAHSALEHRLKASVHLLFFNELPTLSRGESLFNGRPETCLFVEITDDDIRHQPLSVGARFCRDLRQLRFLLGNEVYFHVPKIRENALRGNAVCIINKENATRIAGIEIAGVGILIQLLCMFNSLNPFDTSNRDLVNFGFIAGTLIVVAGCGVYAKAKGRNPAFGLFGVFSVPGFYVLRLLKHRPDKAQ